MNGFSVIKISVAVMYFAVIIWSATLGMISTGFEYPVLYFIFNMFVTFSTLFSFYQMGKESKP